MIFDDVMSFNSLTTTEIDPKTYGEIQKQERSRYGVAMTEAARITTSKNI